MPNKAWPEHKWRIHISSLSLYLARFYFLFFNYLVVFCPKVIKLNDLIIDKNLIKSLLNDGKTSKHEITKQLLIKRKT